MAYGDFTLSKVVKQFQLTIDERTVLFPNVTDEVPSKGLLDFLEEGVPLALAQGTEKARSVAARIFNQEEGTPVLVLHGVVTTGNIWRFLRLRDQTLQIDRQEYYIEQVGRIIGAAGGAGLTPRGTSRAPSKGGTGSRFSDATTPS